MVWQGYEGTEADMSAKQETEEAAKFAGIYRTPTVIVEVGRTTTQLAFQKTIEQLHANYVPTRVQGV